MAMSRSITIALMGVVVLAPSMALACELHCSFGQLVPSLPTHQPSFEQENHYHGPPASHGEHQPAPSQNQHCVGHANAVFAAPSLGNVLTSVETVSAFCWMTEGRLGWNELIAVKVFPPSGFFALLFCKSPPLVLRI